jgi:phosphohistidine phosphatase SixA
LTRAVETAEIAAKELGYEDSIVRVDCLLPDASPPGIWAELRAHRKEESILMAGHEPLFSATVAWMLGSTHGMVEFKKAGLVRIDFETLGSEPRGVLQWMLTPKLA